MGVPETVTGTLANGQLARRYGIPQRVMLGSTANAPDAQSAYETMFSLWAAQLSGAHFVYHAHGWMEGGLTTGFEKTVLDSEMIGMMGALRGNIDLTDADSILDTIREVGPGQHFLGCQHTQENFETAFYRSTIADNNSFEQWEADGSQSAEQRANTLWKKWLAEYEAPPIDPAVDEALLDFMARRKGEFPDSNV